MNGYKKFVQDLGGEFLEFVEVYNECLKIASEYEIAGDVKLSARIKDFSSSNNNTEEKELDDMFGMEVITSTEYEKEFFILFNKLIFETYKSKKYNKTNGYKAYHSDEDLKITTYENLKSRIIELIEHSMVEEWKTPDKTREREKVKLFRKLSVSDIKDDGIIIKALEEMIKRVQTSKIAEKSVPMLEFHFITAAAKEEATRGKASHDKYKKDIMQEQIIELFENGNLYRGINSPWKFEVKDEELVLQDFYKTLIENWPFLREYIVKRREEGKEEEDKKRNAKFDKYLASQFSFLRKYINNDGNLDHIDEIKKAQLWEKIKNFIIYYRLRVEGKAKNPIEEILNLPDGDEQNDDGSR